MIRDRNSLYIIEPLHIIMIQKVQVIYVAKWLLLLLLHKVFSDFRGFLLCVTFEGGLKEEEFEHGKHNEEFYQDDNPQCFAPSHSSKSLGIDAEKCFKCRKHINYTIEMLLRKRIAHAKAYGCCERQYFQSFHELFS